MSRTASVKQPRRQDSMSETLTLLAGAVLGTPGLGCTLDQVPDALGEPDSGHWR